MYFKCDKFIPTLEEIFPDILQQILDSDHQKHNSEQGQGHSVPTISSNINTNFKCDHTERWHLQ